MEVIACWPNRLFDETKGVCTYWQSVDENLYCPEFDGSVMMPDQEDEGKCLQSKVRVTSCGHVECLYVCVVAVSQCGHLTIFYSHARSALHLGFA